MVHPRGGRVFASSAADLGGAIGLSGSTKPRILPCCGDVSIGPAEARVYVVGIADFYRLVLTERHRCCNAKARARLASRWIVYTFQAGFTPDPEITIE